MLPEDELAREHEKSLVRYTEQRVKRFLAHLEGARRDLQAIIAEPQSFTAVRINNLMRQIESIERDTIRLIRSEPNVSEELAPVTRQNLEDVFKTIAPESKVIKISTGSLNTESLYRFSNVELSHVSKVFASNLDTIRSVLYSQIGVLGRNPSQVARELAGRDGRFKGQYGHVETILRTETSTVYNTQSMSGIEYVNKTYELPMRKRIFETIDANRNHPISQILNNQVREVNEPFQASVKAVAAKANELKKSVGGIFWPAKNGFYEGQRLPAHFRERGIVVPTMRQPE